MKIRIPGWVRNQVVPSDLYSYDDGKRLGYTVKVNGQPVTATLEKGYFTIDRNWKKVTRLKLILKWNPVWLLPIPRSRPTVDV